MRILLLLCLASPLVAAEPTYWTDVRPLLRKHCTVCHSAKTLNEPDVSAGLALDTLEAIRKGGKTPVIKTQDGKGSLLVTILRHPKPARRMPLDAEPLSDAQVTMLTQWINGGLVEGTKPAETDVVTPPSPPRKKRDVVVASKLVLPKNVAKPGQTQPLEAVLPVGPLSPVAAVALHPQGKWLAVGSYGRVIVWDLTTGRPAKFLTNVLGAVNDLKFSPDGTHLAVAGGQPSARGDVRLFAVADWKLTTSFSGHTDVVSGVAFTPDSTHLASASFDKTVRVWNLATKTNVSTFTGHSDFVYAVAFGPKGDWYATASKDRTSRLVETKSSTSRLTFSGTDQEVVGVAVVGENVVTSGLDPALSWWNTQTGERTKRVAGHSSGVNEIATTPETLVSAGADSTVRLWNPKTMDAVRTLTVGSHVYAATASKDGKLVVSGSYDGLARVWDAATGRLLVSLLAVSEDEWFALTPEGFAACADPLQAKLRWRVNGKDLAAAWVWAAVKQPESVAKACSGAKLPEVTFAAPQP